VNIVFNRLKKTLVSVAIVAVLQVLSTTVLAGPKQLDILGLVPGVSDVSQIRQVAVEYNESQSILRIEIGGEKTPCNLDLLNGKLAQLLCLTGNERGRTRYTDASNTEVHLTLKVGFTKKFGKPDTVISNPLRTRMGVQYQQEIVTWEDLRGNRLSLVSISGSIDTGYFSVQSSEYLKQEAEKKIANDSMKKF